MGIYSLLLSSATKNSMTSNRCVDSDGRHQWIWKLLIDLFGRQQKFSVKGHSRLLPEQWCGEGVYRETCRRH